PSSRPISSAILPFSIRRTVVPVNRIFRPVAAGNDPMRKSLKAGPVCVPAAFPAADHVVALGDEVRSAPKVEVRECFTEPSHESLDICVAATRRMQRILQEHVVSGELVDDVEIAGFAPELREPAAYDGLVVLFLRHDDLL